MDWETPSFEVVHMNAEIGSYQNDFDVEDERAEQVHAPPRAGTLPDDVGVEEAAA